MDETDNTDQRLSRHLVSENIEVQMKSSVVPNTQIKPLGSSFETSPERNEVCSSLSSMQLISEEGKSNTIEITDGDPMSDEVKQKDVVALLTKIAEEAVENIQKENHSNLESSNHETLRIVGEECINDEQNCNEKNIETQHQLTGCLTTSLITDISESSSISESAINGKVLHHSEKQRPFLKCKRIDGIYRCLSCNTSMILRKPFTYHIWEHIHVNFKCKICEKNNITSTPDNVCCPVVLSTMAEIDKQSEVYPKKLSYNANGATEKSASESNSLTFMSGKGSEVETPNVQSTENSDTESATSVHPNTDSLLTIEPSIVMPINSHPTLVSKDNTKDQDSTLLTDMIDVESSQNIGYDDLTYASCESSVASKKINVNINSDDSASSNDIFVSAEPTFIIRNDKQNKTQDKTQSNNSQTVDEPKNKFVTSQVPSDDHGQEDSKRSKPIKNLIECRFVDGKYKCLTCNVSMAFTKAFAYHTWKHLHAERCHQCVHLKIDTKVVDPLDIKCPIVLSLMQTMERNRKLYDIKEKVRKNVPNIDNSSNVECIDGVVDARTDCGLVIKSVYSEADIPFTVDSIDGTDSAFQNACDAATFTKNKTIPVRKETLPQNPEFISSLENTSVSKTVHHTKQDDSSLEKFVKQKINDLIGFTGDLNENQLFSSLATTSNVQTSDIVIVGEKGSHQVSYEKNLSHLLSTHIEKLEHAKGYYTCGFPGCPFSCTTDREFSVHLNEDHLGEVYTCVFCCHSFSSASYLIDHMKSHQSGSKKFMLFKCSMSGKCKFCSNHRSEFDCHLKTHHPGSRVFPCSFCREKYESGADLIEHLCKNLMKIIHCSYCFVRSVSRAHVVNHILQCHPYLPKRVSVTSRMCCQDKFGKPMFQQPSPEEKLLKCGACGIKVCDVDSLTDHLRSCEKAKNFHRTMAETNGSANASVPANINTSSLCQTHSASKELKCKKCNFVHCDADIMAKHETDHVEYSKYQCVDCQKDFTVLRSLKIHIAAIHFGSYTVKIHQCNYCRVKSNNNRWMAQHFRKRHPDSTTDEDLIEKIVQCDRDKCSSCGFVYSISDVPGYIKHALQNHKSDSALMDEISLRYPGIPGMMKKCIEGIDSNDSISNNKQRPVNKDKDVDNDEAAQYGQQLESLPCSLFCAFCEAEFDSLDTYKSHIAPHFSGKKVFKLFKCQICDFLATNKLFLRNHLKENHPMNSPHMEIQEMTIFGTKLLDVDKTTLLSQQGKPNSLDKNQDHECFYCEETFKTKFFVHKHIYYNHQEKELEKMGNQIIQCWYCNFSAKLEYKIRYHLRMMHKSLKYKVLRKTSTESVVDDGKNELELESENFCTKLANNRFQCTECSFTAYHKTKVKRHFLYRHAQTKPKKCQHCNFSAVETAKLQKHYKLSHPDDLPLVEDVPEKDHGAFAKESSKDLPSSEWTKIGPYKFKCNKCSFTQETLNLLKRHVYSVHYKFHQFQCKYCDFTAAERYKITKHGRTLHKKVGIQVREPPDNLLESVYKDTLSRKRKLSEESKTMVNSKCSKIEQEIVNVLDGENKEVIENKDLTEKAPQLKPKSEIVEITTRKERYSVTRCGHCLFSNKDVEEIKKHCSEKHPHFYPNSKSNVKTIEKERIVKVYKCKLCDFSSESSRFYVIRHYENKHSNKEKMAYNCKYCSYRSPRLDHLTMHHKNCHANDTFSDPQLEPLSLHVSRDNDKSRKSSASGSSDRESPKHGLLGSRKLEYIHGELLPPLKSGSGYSCPYCKFTSTTKAYVDRHLVFHGPHLYRCQYCIWKGFFTSEAQRHCKLKHPQEKLLCIKIKQKQFKKAEKTVTKENDDQKEYNQANNRNRYQCGYCAYQTSYLSRVQKHEKSSHPSKIIKIKVLHSVEKLNKESDLSGVFKCEFCDFSTKIFLSLKKHMGKHLHGFLCMFCDYSAPIRFNLNCHIAKKHPGRDLLNKSLSEKEEIHLKYSCNYCLFDTENEIDYVTHLAQHSDVFRTISLFEDESKNMVLYVNVQPRIAVKNLKRMSSRQLALVTRQHAVQSVLLQTPVE